MQALIHFTGWISPPWVSGGNREAVSKIGAVVDDAAAGRATNEGRDPGGLGGDDLLPALGVAESPRGFAPAVTSHCDRARFELIQHALIDGHIGGGAGDGIWQDL